MRQDASYEDARLREAARVYAAAFRADPIDYYPGINAVTMAWMLRELTHQDDRDLDVEAMAYGVRWAVSCRLLRDPKPQWYWARASLAELEVLTGCVDSVERAYKDASAVADNDWFALDSSKPDDPSGPAARRSAASWRRRRAIGPRRLRKHYSESECCPAQHGEHQLDAASV
jgi:hypothetical protein